MSSVSTAAGTLQREIDRVATFIESVDEDAWEQPTRCPPLTFREMLAHMLRGTKRLNAMLDEGPVEDQPEGDALTYWRIAGAVPDAEQPIASDVVDRAQHDAEGFTPADLTKAWRNDWDAVLARVQALKPEDPVMPSPFARMRMSEYLRTRHIEVVVHHMDLRDAAGQAPGPDPAALHVVCEVLAGMLGADPVRLGMDPIRFALAGTGRETLNDSERAMLGPLVSKFPLIV
jgi:uncharacterized protein (TIGR03083 family)